MLSLLNGQYEITVNLGSTFQFIGRLKLLVFYLFFKGSNIFVFWYFFHSSVPFFPVRGFEKGKNEKNDSTKKSFFWNDVDDESRFRADDDDDDVAIC